MAMSRSYYASPYYGNSEGGKRWEDGIFTSVKKITMTENAMTLISAQFHYGLDGHDPSVRGKSFGGVVHGGVKNGATTKEFVLSPHDCLTKMTGYKGMYRDEWNNEWCVIKSLTFYTKETMFSCGPKGSDSDFFETNVDGKILGFFGSASEFLLDSIGVYMLLD